MLPIYLTLLRIALIPVMVYAYLSYPQKPIYTVIIFAFSGITDWLDGFFARYLKAVTAFGRFLDPVADKLVVVTVLMLLTTQSENIWYTVGFILMVLREIFMMAIREWMAKMSQSHLVSVNNIGKIKTFIQFIAISVIIFFMKSPGIKGDISFFALLLGVFLAIWSLAVYLFQARPYLTRAQDGA